MVQEIGESVDAVVADIRRFAHSCEYGTFEDSIMSDRISIRNDTTHWTLLQKWQLDLNKAIDVK